MPRKFTRVNEVENWGHRRAVSADAALSETSPYLGSAWVRWSLQQDPGMQPDQPPSPILLLGRDRSPSGPAPQTWAL